MRGATPAFIPVVVTITANSVELPGLSATVIGALQAAPSGVPAHCNCAEPDRFCAGVTRRLNCAVLPGATVWMVELETAGETAKAAMPLSVTSGDEPPLKFTCRIEVRRPRACAANCTVMMQLLLGATGTVQPLSPFGTEKSPTFAPLNCTPLTVSALVPVLNTVSFSVFTCPRPLVEKSSSVTDRPRAGAGGGGAIPLPMSAMDCWPLG